MNRFAYRILFALIATAWSSTAEAGGLLVIRGIDGETDDAKNIFNNDLTPNPGLVYEQDGTIKSWTVDGDADDRPSEDDLRISFLNGQSPTLTPAGTWAVDGFFDVSYSIALQQGADPFVEYSGLSTAHIVGTAPGGSEPRQFSTWRFLSLNLSGVLDGVTPFMIRESPTLASTGRTKIKALSGGQFHINSFFKVATEMSLDGGLTSAHGCARTIHRPAGRASSFLLLLAPVAGSDKTKQPAILLYRLRATISPSPGRNQRHAD